MDKKIAITTSSFADYNKSPIHLLQKVKFELKINRLGHKLDKEETLRLCHNCIGIIAGTELYDRDILARLDRLRVISRCGAGLDNIDLEAAGKLKIKIANTPTAPTLAVAELTVGLIFDLLRNISLNDREIRNGAWKKRMGNLINGKNVGIIGFGRIGKKLAKLLRPFGVNIAYYDINEKLSVPFYLRKKMHDLLRWADIISVNVDSKKTIIGEMEIKFIKKGAWFINTSRGGVIAEDALYRALKSKHLSGAALDVFTDEPYSGPLRGLDNIILTPHIGSYAIESRIKMEIQAVENLLKQLKGSGIYRNGS